MFASARKKSVWWVFLVLLAFSRQMEVLLDCLYSDFTRANPDAVVGASVML